MAKPQCPLSSPTETTKRFHNQQRVVRGLVLVALLATSLCLWPWIEVVRSLFFERTPCTIVSSQLQLATPGRSGKSPSYRIAVSYEFDWQGRRIRSDQYDFRWSPSFITEAKRQAVLALKPGALAECWVNPRDPDEAVMDRSLTASHAIVALPGGFLVLGLLTLRFGMRADRNTNN